VTPALGIPASGDLQNCSIATDALEGGAIIGDGSGTVVIELENDVTSDGVYSGTIITLTVDSGVGNTSFGQAYHVDTDGELVDADADGIATMPAIGLAVEVGTGSKKILISGIIVETDWNWTIGGLIYVSTDPTTTEGLTQTAPSGSGDQVQIVGVALSANAILVTPNYMLIEIN